LVPGTARERLAELLGGLAEPAASSAYRKLFMTDLSVAVDGVGPLRFPVSEEQAAQLRGLGRRAQFGHREETLTDPEVRDTWEIPKALVHIEWTDAFEDVIEEMRDELGLPPHCELTPDFHSMLVYETGQFFVTHQDSEKDDTMVGTLVVTLPSAHTGGELVIEHRGQTMEYRGSKVAVSLVAFYSDCHHQVLPVKTGNRITLTYNLLLKGDTSAAAEDTMAGELAACLDEHFAAPVTLPYGGGEADPPIRLVYLLDHEYTARGLSWSRLKGSDADRAALLRAAADRAGCEVVLALADIQETWDAVESDAADPWHDYENYDEDYEEEEDEGSGGAADPDDEQYVLQDLIDSSITLARWISPGGNRPEEISLTIRDAEVSATTSSADLTPYASEYEGYMGNYGNTLDRWYRRAALVIWPRSQGFANRAQASSAWALDEIDELVRTADITNARDAAQTLASFWNTAISSHPQGVPLGKALRTVRELDDAETAAMLLRPFRLEQLVPDHASALADLAMRYGDIWTADLLRDWSSAWRPGAYAHSPDLSEWISDLPRLCAALRAEGSAGITTAQRILDLSWNWFVSGVRPFLTRPSTSSRDKWLGGLGWPLAGILTAAAETGSAAVLDDAVELGHMQGDQVTSLVMATLRAARTLPAGSGHGRGFDALAVGCAERLRKSLARPQRAPDDWSVEPPTGCTCDLCGTLSEFLRNPKRRTLEWPLAKALRAHVHSRIDGGELPVRHETRRQGRPYALVLTKTEALFERERCARKRNETDLTWLTENWEPVS
jgi:predicted 2-oxoglutarate/Fe(II)-dependent dioxygenase YbiX